MASAPAPLALSIIDRLEHRFPDHQVDLVVAEHLFGQLSTDQRSRVVFVVGRKRGRLTFLSHARRTPYWMIAVVLGGQPGYLSMKLAGLLLGIGRIIICYNEGADAFAVDRHHLHVIVAFLRHRFGARGGVAFTLHQVLLGSLYAVFGEPLGLIWMMLQITFGRLQAWATTGAYQLDQEQ